MRKQHGNMSIHGDRSDRGELPSSYYVDPSIFEGETDSSVCGVVYIATESEAGAYQPKSSQAGSLHQEAYASSWAQAKKCGGRRLICLSIFALAVLVSIIIGISVGVSQQRRGQQSEEPTLPATKATAAISTAVPFSVRTAVAAPAGAAYYTCDVMFGTDETIKQYTSRVEAAYAAQLAHISVESVKVTRLTCDGVDYALATTGAEQAVPVEMAMRRHLLEGSSSSSSNVGAGLLEVITELEFQRHEYVDDVRAHTDAVLMKWMGQARAAAAAVSNQIIPAILANVFKVTISGSSVSILQLPAVTTSSSRAAGSAAATEVTQTTTDPSTGEVIGSQTIVLPPAPANALTPATMQPSSSAASSSTADTPGAASSSNASTSTDTGITTDSRVTCGAECSLANSEAKCVQGQCMVDRCYPGWEDCDGLAANGCEANVLEYFTDNGHCGGCGKVCLVPLTCMAGQCALQASKPSSRPGAADATQLPGGEGDDDTSAPVPVPAQASQGPAPNDKEQPAATPVPTPTEQPAAPAERPAIQPPAPAPAEQPAPAPAQQPAAPEEQPPIEQPAEDNEPPVTDSDADGSAPSPASSSSTSEPVPTPPAPAAAAEQPAADATATPAKTPSAGDSKPLPAPVPLVKGMPVLYDDVVRLGPSDSSITIDVLKNDNLGGHAAKDLAINILIPPASGATVVLPATASSGSGADARPSIRYTPAGVLGAGEKVEIYYSVAAAGQLSPAPGTVSVIGAAAATNPTLLDCSPAAQEMAGTPVPKLSRADDASSTVALPFPVTLYGEQYTAATVSTNGWVAFGPGAEDKSCNIETQWPGAPCLGTGPVLAVFWDDLLPDSVLTYHDEKLGAFIIQWTNVMFPTSTVPLGTFQAFLFKNGSIAYVYRDLYGSDLALGSSAVVGIRGPAKADKPLSALLESQPYAAAGAGDDAHGSWLYAATLDDPDYLLTFGTQAPFLSPGLALVSHPVKSLSGPSGLSGPNVPGKFQAWESGPTDDTFKLLVAPDAPARPLLSQPVVKSGVAADPSSSQVVTLAWSMPAGPPAVQQFRLFVAADPMFAELLRQPAGHAFAPADIPASTKSVDVVLDSRFAGGEVYVLLMACSEQACRTSPSTSLQLLCTI